MRHVLRHHVGVSFTPGWLTPAAWAFLLLNLVAAALEVYTGRLLEAATTLAFAFGLALTLGLRFGLPAKVAPVAGLRTLT